MIKRLFLIDHPFTDSNVVLSVEHLVRESGIAGSLEDYDTFLGDLPDREFSKVADSRRFYLESEINGLWPVELTGRTNWLDLTMKASLNHLFDNGNNHVRQLLDEYSVSLGHRSLTEEKWIRDFESMLYHVHQLSLSVVKKQRSFASSILTNCTDHIEVKRCIVKPLRNMAMVEIGYREHVRKTSDGRFRRHAFTRPSSGSF